MMENAPPIVICLCLLYSQAQAQKAETALHVSKGQCRFRDPRHGEWVEHYACTTSLVHEVKMGAGDGDGEVETRPAKGVGSITPSNPQGFSRVKMVKMTRGRSEVGESRRRIREPKGTARADRMARTTADLDGVSIVRTSPSMLHGVLDKEVLLDFQSSARKYCASASIRHSIYRQSTCLVPVAWPRETAPAPAFLQSQGPVGAARRGVHQNSSHERTTFRPEERR